MTGLIIRHPEPVRPRQRLVPVFLPYHGCSKRCIFCSQHIQSGAGRPSLNQVYQTLARELEVRAKRNEKGFGLGLFGGTFTALPHSWQKKILDLTRQYREHGLLTHVRCSTRPDRISPDHLNWLASEGLDMVELGVQSFDQDVLFCSRRGYSAQTAHEACAMVQDSGMRLGIQLMPGMPGATTQSWRKDVQKICGLKPLIVRIYPCLVLRDTLLELAYHDRTYRPWSLRRIIWSVGQALLAFWRAGITVARIGLAPEKNLVKNITAGPWHPALGQMARSTALYIYISERMAGLPADARCNMRIFIPKRYSGEFWGHRRELAASWERLGLPASRTCLWEMPFFFIAAYAIRTPSKSLLLSV